MSLTKHDVAIEIQTTAYRGIDPAVAVEIALPILKALLSRLPWWKRFWFTAKALFTVLDEWLDDVLGDDG